MELDIPYAVADNGYAISVHTEVNAVSSARSWSRPTANQLWGNSETLHFDVTDLGGHPASGSYLV